MKIDPVEDWRRLTAHYAGLADSQLQELAADYADLTDTARTVLHDEMRRRGLPGPQAPVPTAARPAARASCESPGAAPDRNDEEFADGQPYEYTWKTPLCECESQEQAWQISEMLRRAGIETWIDSRRSFLPDPTLDLLNPQVLVAADELDRARQITKQPVPQEIVELSRMKPEDYVPPVCPACGAADPILEAVDPANIWRCESCGRQWSDPSADPVSAAGQPDL